MTSPSYKLIKIGLVSSEISGSLAIAASSFSDEHFLAVSSQEGSAALLVMTLGGTFTGRLPIRKVANPSKNVTCVETPMAVTVSPLTSGTAVFIADIGDPQLNRTQITNRPKLIRIEEPTPTALPASLLGHEIYLQFPDEPHHAQAFAVDPLTGDGYVFTTETAGSLNVYRVDRSVMHSVTAGPATTAQLELVAVTAAWPVNSGGAVAAVFSDDGLRIMLRDAALPDEACHAVVWERTATQSVATMFQSDPWQIPLPPEPEGRGLAFKAGSAEEYFAIGTEDDVSSIYRAEKLPEAPTQTTTERLSSWCVKLGRPHVLSGLLRDILTRKFADVNNIEDPDLRRLIWKADASSNILIEANHRWLPKQTEKRPAVIIKRNAYQNNKRGIGNQRQGPAADSEGHHHYVTYWVGSHTLFCIGGTGAQAEILGTEVQRELTEFGPEIQKSLGLMQFQVLQIGAVAKLEEAQENFVVPVTIGWAYEQRWKLRYEAPLLTGVSLSMIIEG